MKGWFKEYHRHALAARGISTSRYYRRKPTGKPIPYHPPTRRKPVKETEQFITDIFVTRKAREIRAAEGPEAEKQYILNYRTLQDELADLKQKRDALENPEISYEQRQDIKALRQQINKKTQEIDAIKNLSPSDVDIEKYAGLKTKQATGSKVSAEDKKFISDVESKLKYTELNKDILDKLVAERKDLRTKIADIQGLTPELTELRKEIKETESKLDEIEGKAGRTRGIYGRKITLGKKGVVVKPYVAATIKATDAIDKEISDIEKDIRMAKASGTVGAKERKEVIQRLKASLKEKEMERKKLVGAPEKQIIKYEPERGRPEREAAIRTLEKAEAKTAEREKIISEAERRRAITEAQQKAAEEIAGEIGAGKTAKKIAKEMALRIQSPEPKPSAGVFIGEKAKVLTPQERRKRMTTEEILLPKAKPKQTKKLAKLVGEKGIISEKAPETKTPKITIQEEVEVPDELGIKKTELRPLEETK